MEITWVVGLLALAGLVLLATSANRPRRGGRRTREAGVDTGDYTAHDGEGSVLSDAAPSPHHSGHYGGHDAGGFGSHDSSSGSFDGGGSGDGGSGGGDGGGGS